MRKNKQINIDLVEIIQNEFNQLPKYEKEKNFKKSCLSARNSQFFRNNTSGSFS